MERAYASEASAPKQERQIAAMVNASLKLNEMLSNALQRTNEMRGRLLGLREPAQLGEARTGRGDAPTPPGHELAELRLNLERMGNAIERLHSNLSDLEAI